MIAESCYFSRDIIFKLVLNTNVFAFLYDTETIENRDDEPLRNLLNDLGGWPVLGTNDGGNWNESEYDFETLMGHLSGQYNNDVVVGSFVGTDDKDSTRRVLFVRKQKFSFISLITEAEQFLKLFFVYGV